MAWFALARALFVAAVVYAAAALRPLPVNLPLNLAFALSLAVGVVWLESRLRQVSVTRILGALIGCAIGLDRKSTRLNSSHHTTSRMPSSA